MSASITPSPPLELFESALLSSISFVSILFPHISYILAIVFIFAIIFPLINEPEPEPEPEPGFFMLTVRA